MERLQVARFHGSIIFPFNNRYRSGDAGGTICAASIERKGKGERRNPETHSRVVTGAALRHRPSVCMRPFLMVF